LPSYSYKILYLWLYSVQHNLDPDALTYHFGVIATLRVTGKLAFCRARARYLR